MDIERTEEETVEHLKQWFRENGLALALGVVIGLSSIAGVRYWFSYQRTQAEEASLIYEKVSNALNASFYADVLKEGKVLQDSYSSTAYAVLASMAMAKASLDSGDAAAARTHLTWALENADDEGLRHVARVRLARLLIDAKDYAAAMKLITDQGKNAFSAVYEGLRGDILLAQNNPSLAREAYRSAIVDETDGTRRQFLQMKLDSISAEAPAVAPAAEAAQAETKK